MTDPMLLKIKQDVAPYEKSDLKSSIWQLINTVGPLLFLWYAAYVTLSVSYWLTLPITMIAAGFLVRTFIIFHDCCHQSFFKSKLANDILGNITGVLTIILYQKWKNQHAIHHSTSSNLDKRGTGDIWMMTVDEYVTAPLLRKLAYRIYRNPVVMFGIGPTFAFLVQTRFNRKEDRRKERINTYMMNIYVAALYALMCLMVGWQAFVMIQAPIFLISGLLGIWLFYVQHQFEDSYFENEDEWSYVMAAVEGSSYYKLPKPLQWITGNIGFHHVHHFSTRVPNYNLEKVHYAAPSLQKATTITLLTSLQSINFRLWDKHNRKFVSFRKIKHLLRKPASVYDPPLIRKPGLQGK